MSSAIATIEDSVNDILKSLSLSDNHYLIVDIGANLTNRKFAKDLDSVIQRAKDSGKLF